MKYIALLIPVFLCARLVGADDADEKALLEQLQALPAKVFTAESSGKERQAIEAWLSALGDRRERTAILGMVVFMIQAENWKRRWDQDTRELTDELKKTQEQLVEQSMQRTKAENAMKAKDAEIADLKAQLTKAGTEKKAP